MLEEMIGERCKCDKHRTSRTGPSTRCLHIGDPSRVGLWTVIASEIHIGH